MWFFRHRLDLHQCQGQMNISLKPFDYFAPCAIGEDKCWRWPLSPRVLNNAHSKADFASISHLITWALSQSESPLALHWGDLEIKVGSCCVSFCNNLTKHRQVHLEAFINIKLEGCEAHRSMISRMSSCFSLALPALEKWVTLSSGF